MDPAQEVCEGCLRTLDEIARWRDMSDAEREGVLEMLAARRVESLKNIPVKI